MPRLDSRCGQAAQHDPSTTSWNALVVLLEGSVDAAGKPSQAALRRKNLLLLAAQSSQSQELFTVVTREELTSKVGDDPKALAGALRQLVKQDSAKGRAKKAKAAQERAQEQERLAREAERAALNLQQKQQPNVDDDDGNDAPETEIPSPKASSLVAMDSLAQRRMDAIDQTLELDDTLRLVPSVSDLALARSVLEITDEEASPDRVYLLSGYPASPEEAAPLLPLSGGEGLLDVVLELNGNSGIDVEDYSLTTHATEPADRSLTRLSDMSVRTAGPQGRGKLSNTLGDPHKASASSLPNPSVRVETSAISALTSPSSTGTEENPVLPTSSNLSNGLVGPTDSKESLRDAASLPFVDGAGFAPTDKVAALKQAQAHAEGPGWNDVTFLELPVVPQKESDDPGDYSYSGVILRFCALVQAAGKEKFRFLEFLSLCEHVTVPRGIPPAGDELVAKYAAILDAHAELPGQCTVSLVVDAILRAVLEEAPLKLEGSELPPTSTEYGDASQVDLLETCIGGDRVPTPVPGLSAALRIERHLWRLVRVPGGLGRQWMPRNPKLTVVERGVAKTQLRAFHTFAAERLSHIQLLERFEELLTKSDPRSRKAWDFGGRVVVREMSPQVVCQVVGGLVAREPEVHVNYDQQEDLLLVALHRQTPIGRRSEVRRSAFRYTSLRPTLREWPTQDLRALPRIYDVEKGSIANLEQRATILFPCDGSLIRLESLPRVKRSWCSVERDGHRFGLRAVEKMAQRGQGAVYSSFEDGSLLEVQRGPAVAAGSQGKGKPDGFATMVSMYTARSGLHVRHASDGSIRMSAIQSKCKSCGEVERLVTGSGSVIVYLEDGTKQLLCVDGSYAEMGPQATEFGGWRTFSLAVESVALAKTVAVAKDPDTGALVFHRKTDDVIRIDHPDGTRFVRHANGTLIVSERGSRIVRVEAEGFATVKMYCDVEATAAKHGRGGRVDISRGNRNTRSSTLLPDATVIHIEYDTRVTAKTNGHIRVIKPDGTTIEVADNGLVAWRPWDVEQEQRRIRQRIERVEQEKKLVQDAREEPDRNLGCFLFNCDDSSMQTRDWESNVFTVKNALSPAQCTIEVNLSGAADEQVAAVINQPISPRLFVMRGDGTGYELLSDAQVSRERARLERRFRSKFSPVAVKAIDLHAEAEKAAARARQKEQMLRDPLARLRTPKGASAKSPRGGGGIPSPPGGELEAFELELCTPLEPLRSAWRHGVPFLHQLDAADRFPNMFLGHKPRRETMKELKQLSCTLVDTVRRVKPVSKLERAELSRAEQQFLDWKAALSATEDRFNVDDPRPMTALNEERRMQQLIAKEMRRIEKAEKKLARKLAAAAAAHGADGSLNSSRSSRSHRSHKSHRSHRSTVSRRSPGARIDRPGGGTEESYALSPVPDGNEELDSEHSGSISGSSSEGEEERYERPPAPELRNVPVNPSGLNYWAEKS